MNVLLVVIASHALCRLHCWYPSIADSGREKVWRFPVKIRQLALIRITCQERGTVRSGERHEPQEGSKTCRHRRTEHRGSDAHVKEMYCIDCGANLDSVPRAIHDELATTRSSSSAFTAHDDALAAAC